MMIDDEQNHAPSPDGSAPDPAPLPASAAKLHRRTGRERLEATAAAKAAKATKDAAAQETPEQRKQRKLKQKLYLVHAAEKRILAQLAPPKQMPRDEQWKRNHAALSDGERSELEMAQAKTVQLAAVMMACCRDLDNGRRPGPDPETDTFWVDNVFVEALEHQKGTGSLNRIVWHPDAQEFTRMQRDRLVFELFSTADPNWYAFGMYSVLPTWLWEKFLKTVVTFFRANPDYVASDGEMLDSEIVAQAIALYDSTHHRRLRTAHTHENCTPEELEQAQAIRVAGEVKRAAERFEQERVAMLKSLLNPAQSDSDGRGKPR